MRLRTLPLLLAGVAVIGGQARAADDKPADLETAARDFLTTVAKGEFEAATKNFDDTMKKVMPADKLEEAWKKVQAQVGGVGPFKGQAGAVTTKAGKYDAVLVTCQFEKMALVARVVFDEQRRISGLFFQPPPAEFKAPAYVKRDAFRETEVKVGEGEWVLPGTLSLPVGEGPFPAVVLVHGSGPQDRDETILGNKPFRDLAWGLASRQIAVLRYDKRTQAHQAKLVKAKDKITIKEEVTEDALAAAALLRKTKGVDPKQVFLLGHSLGAMMAPRLGKSDAELAGLILLAAPTRPLEDLIVEQIAYIASLGEKLTDRQKSEIDKLKEQAARVKDPKLTADTPGSELPFGVAGAYWVSLRGYEPAGVAAELKQPLLILQGERDYQVTTEDFAGWKKALAGHKNAELKSYPKLNHLFMEGEGKSKPAEYFKAGHVAVEVIDDVAAWIKKR
jgi:dienelactone hydrolase